MPAVLASRVRVLSSGKSDKNDSNDARSVAIAALRQPGLAVVRREDHTQVLRMLAKHHLELTSQRTQTACRLHAVLMQLRPGGMAQRLSAKQASRIAEIAARDTRLAKRAQQVLLRVSEVVASRSGDQPAAFDDDTLGSLHDLIDRLEKKAGKELSGALAEVRSDLKHFKNSDVWRGIRNAAPRVRKAD